MTEKSSLYRNDSGSKSAAASETAPHALSMPAVPVVQAKSNFAKGKSKPAEKKPLDADGIAEMVKTVTTQRKTNDSAFMPVQAMQDKDSNHSMQAFNPQHG